MNSTAREVLKITYGPGVYALFFVASALCLIVTWPWGLLLVLEFAIFVAVTAMIPAVSVRDQGVVLYCVNHLAWDQVAAVRGSKVFGLPYAVVTRHKGFR